jgi:hypothetical protein
MDFNFAEIDYLISRGILREEKRNTFGINFVDYGGNGQGFGYRILTKQDNGEIREVWSTPTNVDPDWGTYDDSGGTRLYKNFEDFKNHKPYKET